MYSPANLYQPRVTPDTSGVSGGIAQVGSAFAGALNTHSQNVRTDERNAELRNQQLADREQLYMRQDSIYARGRSDELSDRGALWDRQDGIMAQGKADAKTQKEQEELRELAASAGAVAALAQSGYLTADQLAFYDSVPDKQKSGVAEQLIKFGGFNAATRAQERQAEAARAKSRETYVIPNPLTGEPHQGHFMTGNGQTLPVYQAKPEVPVMTPEQMQQFGLELQGASINGKGQPSLRYGLPKAEAGVTGGLLYDAP